MNKQGKMLTIAKPIENMERYPKNFVVISGTAVPKNEYFGTYDDTVTVLKKSDAGPMKITSGLPVRLILYKFVLFVNTGLKQKVSLGQK
jgi:hypothetical protein